MTEFCEFDPSLLFPEEDKFYQVKPNDDGSYNVWLKEEDGMKKMTVVPKEEIKVEIYIKLITQQLLQTRKRFYEENDINENDEPWIKDQHLGATTTQGLFDLMLIKIPSSKKTWSERKLKGFRNIKVVKAEKAAIVIRVERVSENASYTMAKIIPLVLEKHKPCHPIWSTPRESPHILCLTNPIADILLDPTKIISAASAERFLDSCCLKDQLLKNTLEGICALPAVLARTVIVYTLSTIEDSPFFSDV